MMDKHALGIAGNSVDLLCVESYDSFCSGVKLADTSSIPVTEFTGTEALLEQVT
jgi:hypothetical protein